MRRLIRRGYDHFSKLSGNDISPIIEAVVEQYRETDQGLVESFEEIKNTILEEIDKYSKALHKAKAYIMKKYEQTGDELMGVTEIFTAMMHFICIQLLTDFLQHRLKVLGMCLIVRNLLKKWKLIRNFLKKVGNKNFGVVWQTIKNELS